MDAARISFNPLKEEVDIGKTQNDAEDAVRQSFNPFEDAGEEKVRAAEEEVAHEEYL